jgi:4'-phosphopantetheinyl transferase EntD
MVGNRPFAIGTTMTISSAELKVHEDWAIAALQEIFPRGCGVACKVRSWPVDFLPEREAIAVKNAAHVRKGDFAAGRMAAREALEKIGFFHAIIPAGVDRAPIWPAGATGSIAHTGGLAIAVAARKEDLSAVGVDLETSMAVAEDLWPQVLVPTEITYLLSLPEVARRQFATVIFCIKEAFYKFQYQHTRQWLGFQDVEVVVGAERENCRLRTKLPIQITDTQRMEFDGRYRLSDAFTLAAIY